MTAKLGLSKNHFMEQHYIQHPNFSREQLHGKRFALLRSRTAVQQGRLEAGASREDGRYILTFQPEAVPDPDDLLRSWTKEGEPATPSGTIQSQPEESLDQATVAKIRTLSPTDICTADFVLDC